MIKRVASAGLLLSLITGAEALAQPQNGSEPSEQRFDFTPLQPQIELAQASTSEAEIANETGDAPASEADNQAALAKAAQNPIASMISIPIQWNATPGTQWAPNSIDPDAEHDRVMNVVNVQPVFPFTLSDDWTLVTRTIVPFVGAPFAEPKIGLTDAGNPYVVRWNEEQRVGVGDINPSAFFVPTLEGDFTFGFGPTIGIPVSNAPISTGKWTAGPAAVGVYTKGPWVVGGLVNNMWSFAGDDDRADVNKMLIQPFINYNLPKGWYISVSPIITADWENDDNGWTVPVGAGVGRVFKVGKQPINMSVHGYYNAIKPEIGGEELMGDWTIRTQIQFLILTMAKK